LAEQKAGLKHGKWLAWLEENVGFSERTARNYVRVFENRERLKSASVADLNDAYLLLTPTEWTCEVSKTINPASQSECARCAENDRIERRVITEGLTNAILFLDPEQRGVEEQARYFSEHIEGKIPKDKIKSVISFLEALCKIWNI